MKNLLSAAWKNSSQPKLGQFENAKIWKFWEIIGNLTYSINLITFDYFVKTPLNAN